MLLFQTIRNNWKKSLCAFSAVIYGLDYTKKQYDISKHMRTVSRNVAEYGFDNGLPKRVLVIMNPVANNKKSEKMFKKYCEPLLHLAGFSVDIVKTNYTGNAKSLIENLEQLPDVVVVAGGDGTASEVVTGLMRRSNASCPIALLPLGSSNYSALKYTKEPPKTQLEQITFLTNSIMALITQKYREESVIKFEVLENNEENKNKPIYGLNRFSWGLLRDIDAIKNKYWVFGSLRFYAAALFHSFSSNIVWNFKTQYIYTPPCDGCRNCYVTKHEPSKKLFLRKFYKLKNDGENYLNYENDQCQLESEGVLETSQISILAKKKEQTHIQLESKYIDALSSDFTIFRKIFKMYNNEMEPAMTLQCRTIQLKPETNDNNQPFYCIDGEDYDARPIKLSIIPNAIKIFSSE